MEKIKQIVEEIFNKLETNDEGEVASYIPELASVDPSMFSISICDVQGNILNKGNHDKYFCLQSCSKPLSYCIAHDQLGRETLHKHVGYEPSGQSFNAFILNRDGLPHNPMINAGAIMVASQICKSEEPSQRFNTISSYYTKMCGNQKIGFDNSVFLSEQHHADRNISLAYYMRENGAYKETVTPNKVTDNLNLYFQQCSMTITSEMGAIIASTLANGGVCPTTNERVVTTCAVKDCLTLMYGCGMYDYSGQFAFEVGLPAKSGVSGCILLVIPNMMGICIWSPLLDKQGNSIRGIEFCKLFNEKLDLHIFHSIINNKIDLNATITNNFIGFCSSGDIESVKQMIDNVDVNCSDYDYRTPLHLAASEGHEKIVSFLIENGAISKEDRWKITPMEEIKDKKGDNYDTIRDLLNSNE